MRMEGKPLARDFDSFAYAAQRPQRQNPFAKHLGLQLRYNNPQIHDKNNHSTFVLSSGCHFQVDWINKGFNLGSVDTKPCSPEGTLLTTIMPIVLVLDFHHSQ